MQIYTKEYIDQLALRDPTVKAHIDAQRYIAGISYETMLRSLVVCLVEEKQAALALSADRLYRANR